MIRAVIQTTPFCTDIANGFFANISGERYNGDSSFVSTLRALLAPRLPDGEYLDLHCTASTPSKSKVSEDGIEAVVRNALERVAYTASYTLNIHMFAGGSTETNEECVKELYEKGLSYLGDDWKRDDVTTAMFRARKFMVACFVNPTTKTSVVFVDGGDFARYHTIQAAIPKFLPWYFEAKEGERRLSEEEMALVNSLYNGHEASEYISALEKMSLKYDLKTARIKKMLGGFEAKIDEQRKNDIMRNLSNINDHISSLNREIREDIERKREQDLLLLGINAKIAQEGENSEIMNYFLSNKVLELEDVSGDSLTFGVKDYMMYFDESLVQRMIENHGSYIYSNREGSPISGKDMALLIKEIFLEQSLKLRVCAAYRMRLRSGIEGLSNYTFGTEYDGYLPNPHIQNYHCLGGYNEKLNRFMADGNYLGALEQCTASCRSLNFGDSTAICNFMKTLYMRSPKCIELPDGKVVTPAEAISWIKERDAQEPQEEHRPELVV